ncbi:MAG: hypothetical protein SFW67_24575 [Myxococcaceae bacterium]|nr:hypothetical protein [Myxococcaceae bacterium]
MTRAVVVFVLAAVLVLSPARALWTSPASAPLAFVVFSALVALGAWSARDRER